MQKLHARPGIGARVYGQYSSPVITRSYGQWDCEAKHRAAMAILRPDGAAVTFDDRARDRQSQSRPLRLRGDERLENARQTSRRNALSGIRYHHFGEVVLHISAGPNGQVARYRLVRHGVHAIHDQVDYHLLHMDCVSFYRQGLNEVYGHLGCDEVATDRSYSDRSICGVQSRG
jgi:hypothetical protein